MVQRTDAEAKRDKLQTWLASKLPSAEDISISPLVKLSSGQSSEIHYFDLHYREAGQEHEEKLVIRAEAMVLRVFPVYDLGKEFNPMRCLHGSGVPVPKMYWLEEDERVLQDLSGGVDDVLCEFKCGKDVGYGILESVVITA